MTAPTPLTLRHASKRRGGPWGADDYDVMCEGRSIGRIFKPIAAPEDRPWMWTILGSSPKTVIWFSLSRTMRPKQHLPSIGASGSQLKLISDHR
jgi:hypothetical protein